MNKFWKWLGSLFAASTMPTNELELTPVIATSFADPADIRRFQSCRDQGHSESYCLRQGDNGIGLWGDDTTTRVPMCALPREDWEHLGAAARGKRVLVEVGDQRVVCELRDTMPRRANIRNGAGIDLNPAAVKAFGLQPPIRIHAVWAWLDE